MKKYIKILNVLFLGIVMLIACKKASYLTDKGIHDAKTPLTTYDYLKQHQYHLFDSLILIIDHYNLKEEMNSAGTVFASTDYSIARYIDAKRLRGNFTMDSLYKYVKADTVRQYFFSDKIKRSNLIDESPRIYTNQGGVVTAVQKQLSDSQADNQWSGAPVYNMWFIKVLDGLDQNATTPLGRSDSRIRCQTADIETSSGGILNVLANTYTFTR
ncbi:MAG: hypothetical protein H7096_07375 [Flavobacterium sp.]|nr:hypothetical protein [Pedobacter sp.]